MFRMVVQDSRRTPSSGKVVARLGSYDPHSKTLTFDKEKASFYLDHGAQPSDRVAILLKKEGVKLPKWVSQPDKQEGKVRNPDKRRSTRPPEPEAEAPATETPAAEEAPVAAETVVQESPAEESKAEDETESSQEKPTEKTEESAE